MATWNPSNIVLTTKGELAIADAESGGGAVTITKVELSSGVVAAPIPANLKALEAVTTFKQAAEITGRVISGNSSSLKIHFDNSGVATAYSLCQIGIYATQESIEGEFLYMVAQCDTPADVIPVPGTTPINWYFDFFLTHTSVSNVTLNVSTTGAVLNTRTINGHALDADVVIGPADLAQSASYRFVTDTEKAAWNNKSQIVVQAAQPTDTTKWWLKEI